VICFLNIQFLILDNITTHNAINNNVMITWTPEFSIGSKSPYPENEIGPRIITSKPPPIRIKIHITSTNPKILAPIKM